MARAIPEPALKLIERFEGFRSQAYWDPWGKVWTVGFGETEGVHQGSFMTFAQAEQDLRSRLEREYAPSVEALGVPLNDNQFSALLSFVWNLGPGSMQWDVGRYLRERNYVAAANAMLAYDRAGGVVLQGLVTRRQAEVALFRTPAGPAAPVDPHHYLWLDGKVRDLGNGHSGSERAVAHEYDNKRRHPFVHRKRLGVLRRDLRVLTGRLEHVMRTDPDGNTRYRRPWRHAQLDARADGRKVVR